MKVGIAGLGTVGSAAAEIIQTRSKVGNSPTTLVAINARDKTKNRGFAVDHLMWFDNADDLARSDDIDIFVELIGGEDGAALSSVKAALKAGKHVVTANKALLAKHGMELAALAEQKGVALRFEAAIAGGIPVVQALREGLKANNINRVFGILNGTCNYILTRMADEGIDFDTCLSAAQELGYAEADPTFDIGGFDTAHKLSLLSSLAFGHETAAESVIVEGIELITQADIKISQSLGYKIKLLGTATLTDNGIEQRVHPTLIPQGAAIARVDGVLNAVTVEGDAVGEVMLVGPGAGGSATASAVVGDIFDITYGDNSPVYGFATSDMKPFKSAEDVSHEGGFYVRLVVKDEVGVFAQIANEMANAGISLKSIMQNVEQVSPSMQSEDGYQTVVMITHNTIEYKLRDAISRLNKILIGGKQILRIETSLNTG